MSARRKKFAKRWKSAKASGKARHTKGLFFKLIVPLIIVLAGFLFVHFRSFYWNDHDKLAFAFKLNTGDVAVTVADPVLSELTTLVIPADTQVDVARNYGTLRLKNVWQLSQNEKLKGRLLPETITRNFLFPVFLWADADGGSIEKPTLPGILKFIFNASGTNIPFGDRVSLGLFALRVPSLGRTEINLGSSQFLKKQKLSDGQPGFVVSSEPSGRLTVYFSDNDLTKAGLKVSIVDATGTSGISDKVGGTIEVMGGKVVSVEKKDPEPFDCEVTGGDLMAVRKIINVFSCSKGNGKSEFDLEIRLGQNFAKRF